MKRDLLKRFWLVIYMFLAIFQPPFFPIPFVYIFGVLTVILLMCKYKMVFSLKILRKSSIWNLSLFFIGMCVYWLFVSFIDIVFITDVLLIENRLRCFNQLIVLTFIQFLSIWYIFILADELEFGIKELLNYIFLAASLQGICVVVAYLSPEVRSVFTTFMDQKLFQDAYFVERRGYGFSMTLIDVFGYGMGLIAGYLWIEKWNKRAIGKIFALVLIIFSIFVNARTGIVVFGIAVIIKMFYGRMTKNTLIKIMVAIPTMCLLVFIACPIILEWGRHSSNITIRWVMIDMKELYDSILYSESSGKTLADASFFSNFGNLPENMFELLFGSGHAIYDTKKVLGFRTDIGYINLLWEFGIIGLIVLLGGLFFWMVRPLKWLKDNRYRMMIWLNIISYFLVLFKGILIGVNPGTYINYLLIFAIYYYTSCDESIRV